MSSSDRSPRFILVPRAVTCMYERVLVPTNGSAHSDLATDHAMTLTEQFGATVHALFVVEQTDRVATGT